jgi:hypothetical protein
MIEDEEKNDKTRQLKELSEAMWRATTTTTTHARASMHVQSAGRQAHTKPVSSTDRTRLARAAKL